MKTTLTNIIPIDTTVQLIDSSIINYTIRDIILYPVNLMYLIVPFSSGIKIYANELIIHNNKGLRTDIEMPFKPLDMVKYNNRMYIILEIAISKHNNEYIFTLEIYNLEDGELLYINSKEVTDYTNGNEQITIKGTNNLL